MFLNGFFWSFQKIAEYWRLVEGKKGGTRALPSRTAEGGVAAEWRSGVEGTGEGRAGEVWTRRVGGGFGVGV